jgi:hypothetical protein
MPSKSDLHKLYDLLTKSRIDTNLNEEDYDEDSQDANTLEVSDELIADDGNWITGSPFYIHFDGINKTFLDNAGLNNAQLDQKNQYYIPDFMHHLCRRYLSIFPLWSSIFLSGSTCRLSNATVENWFRTVKQTIMHDKHAVRVGQFMRKIVSSLAGRLREYELTASTAKKGKVVIILVHFVHIVFFTLMKQCCRV